MKWILISLVFYSSLGVAAVKSSYTLSLGQKAEATLYWQHRQVKNKNVFVIGHQTSGGLRVEQVLPKEEFQRNIQDFKTWRKKLIQGQSPTAGPGCGEVALLGLNKGLLPFCLQGLPRADKTAFLRWYLQQAETLTGR